MKNPQSGGVANGAVRTRRQVWVYCTVGLLAIGCAAIGSSVPLLRGHTATRSVARDDAVLVEIADLRTTLSDLQVFGDRFFALDAPPSPLDMSNGIAIIAATPPKVHALTASLSASGFAGTARQLEEVYADYTKTLPSLSAIAPGRASPERTKALAAVRSSVAELFTVTATAQTQQRTVRDLDMQRATENLDLGRTVGLANAALESAAILLGAFVFGQRARRRQLRDRVAACREGFESSIQRALEMSKAEPDVYAVVDRGLRQAVPHLQVEMLVADSSRAHFRQTLSTGTGDPAARSGCGVVSPQDCPATVRGHKIVFPSSTAIDACPHLRGRPSGECSAACVPMSVTGKTVGVMHATGPDGVPPTDADLDYVEGTSRRASERIGMLRAFEKSETQARVDPLTGLWNRRSLENQVHDLQREGVGYAIAYGDLDHFKVLNDTHGHEAGDQALRLFSRVLRDGIRPNDIAARYGGEEFVIVLPDCDPDVATAVLERVRERLALALTSGRVPAFTISFGLASSLDADTFDEVVAIADQGLLAAKEAGRNRVILASADPSPRSSASRSARCLSAPETIR